MIMFQSEKHDCVSVRKACLCFSQDSMIMFQSGKHDCVSVRKA